MTTWHWPSFACAVGGRRTQTLGAALEDGTLYAEPDSVKLSAYLLRSCRSNSHASSCLIGCIRRSRGNPFVLQGPTQLPAGVAPAFLSVGLHHIFHLLDLIGSTVNRKKGAPSSLN